MAILLVLVFVLLGALGYCLYYIKRLRTLLKFEEEKIEAPSIDDVHSNGLDKQARVALLHELNMREQTVDIRAHAREEEGVLLGEFIDKTVRHYDFELSSAVVHGGKELTLTGAEETSRYRLLSAIVSEGRFSAREATILARLSRFDAAGDEQWFVVTILLEARSEDAETLRVQVTVSRGPLDFLGYHAADAMVRTMMLAYDKLDTNQRQAQFDYMVKEAKDSGVDNLYQLSAEQLEVLSQTSMSWSRATFFGYKYFSEERYYDCMAQLEVVYEALKENYFSLNDYWKQEFLNVCFYLGFCCNHFKMYERAVYYLELVSPVHNIGYSIEYVNALVNSRDVRAMGTLNSMINDVQRDIAEATANGSETSERLLDFYHFLRRRKGYTMIDLGDLDGAEAHFRQLSTEPANHDYAERELNYIRKLREKGS